MFDSAKEKFPDSPSKMIPELKFVFWQKMLMANYEERIWQGCFNSIFLMQQLKTGKFFTIGQINYVN